MITHTPYRAWCRSCVAGRGKSDWHKELTHDAAKPTVSTDYCFMGKRSDIDTADEHTIPICVHRCSMDRWITAHPVRRKGPEEWIV